MKGLMYKDFIAVKGHIFVFSLIGIVGIFSVLRFMFFGNENDVLLGYLFCLVSMILVMIPMMFTRYIFGQDAKSRSRAYLLSLPIKQSDYVASKYVMYIVYYYITIGVITFLSMLYMSAAVDEEMILKTQTQASMMVVLVAVLLIFHAFQFPGYFIYGTQKAYETDAAIAVILFMALLPVALFADFTNFNPDEFFGRYKMIINCVISVFNLAAIIVYYVSYRFTIRHLKVKEAADYE